MLLVDALVIYLKWKKRLFLGKVVGLTDVITLIDLTILWHGLLHPAKPLTYSAAHSHIYRFFDTDA